MAKGCGNGAAFEAYPVFLIYPVQFEMNVFFLIEQEYVPVQF